MVLAASGGVVEVDSGAGSSVVVRDSCPGEGVVVGSPVSAVGDGGDGGCGIGSAGAAGTPALALKFCTMRSRAEPDLGGVAAGPPSVGAPSLISRVGAGGGFGGVVDGTMLTPAGAAGGGAAGAAGIG